MSDRYAVIGNPIGHSKSPLIHAAFARQTGQDIVYEALLAPLDGFVQAVDALRANGGKGANVTVPFKQEAFNLAVHLSERAKLAQAVNTLIFRADGIHGDNTDGAGLLRDIEVNLAYPLAGKRILLLGAGGAARGVIMPLLAAHPASLTIANRTTSRAHDLALQFGHWGEVSACDYSALDDLPFDVIINATSSSLQNDLPPVPDSIFSGTGLVYDMMYGKEPTLFLCHAAQNGAPCVADGLGMLVEQAAESFYLWRGVRPDTAPVIAQLRSL